MARLISNVRVRVREVDGSPNDFCTTLVFPNNSLSFSSNTATVNITGLDLSAIYAQTTDPGVAGALWNNAGYLAFSSAVGFVPSMKFTDSRNSMYLGAL